MLKNKLLIRIITFGIGLFVMALGVALSVKADLGVSPISCIPYVYSIKMPFTLGQLTIVFNIFLMLLQMAVLRKKYRLIQLIQLPVVFAFGMFIDLAMNMVAFISVSSYAWKAFWCLLSCVILAFGVFLEVKAKITYLPGEGLAMAISETFKKEFGKAKIGVDSAMVILGIISSLVFLHQLLGIREGTIVAAVLVGFIAKFFSKKLQLVNGWLEVRATEIAEDDKLGEKSNLVITISREYGSGGHEIGKRLAEKVGIAFYDKSLIDITAKESGFTADFISKNEQKLAHSLLFELYEQNYAYVNEKQPPLDTLFLVQSKIIREIAAKEPCVIVGRCANFVLKENQNCFNLFIHADKKFRKNRITNYYGVHASVTDHELEITDRERANYCMHFTGKNWRDAANYDLTIDSSLIDITTIVDTIVTAIKKRNIYS
ncbi:cytidylate kinase family protein [uncultured Draconibacterium sp.]|uniref:cytidylate kinase family protein n=1 Tax=uncultured Draconibacterium sp. TaxID=1573823 RepID=UPI002AA63C48|nr:cytidylate kinase family protein [uncultured Draconibacterium sp.]